MELRSGETVAVIGPVDSPESFTLLARNEDDPATAIEHFLQFTGVPADKVEPRAGRP
ncbi:hypothetical protein [Actinoplanes sp. TFC3]|uniref:hypothetical protein n=1 Tax=Actinoplanes sp. TFC3 TaxID=1710355 RepID=UPI00137A4E18|nr:hypothetical protein [Actinoplanes sp. TFC3]